LNRGKWAVRSGPSMGVDHIRKGPQTNVLAVSEMVNHKRENPSNENVLTEGGRRKNFEKTRGP